jgi:hypothetical protein
VSQAAERAAVLVRREHASAEQRLVQAFANESFGVGSSQLYCFFASVIPTPDLLKV